MKSSIFESINIVKQCRKYNLSLWQCPQFLFLVLGLVIISSSLAIYFIGVRYSNDPEIVALIVLFIAVFLIIVSFSTIRGFEKLAEVARLKSEFISIVSHQLRAPLSNLKWTIDLLISGKIEPVSKKNLEYLQILKENNKRMEDLVSDLLVISRLEANNIPFKIEKASLVKLAESLVSRSLIFAKACNVEICLKTENNLPDAFFDFQKMEQAAGNLLDNAIRYSQESGKIVISISRKGNWLHFEIKDNGIGIPQEDQKHIFQKFFRANNAARTQVHGSGLGLYIAKSIIEKMGGKISFSSVEGKGSVFVFLLPIKK